MQLNFCLISLLISFSLCNLIVPITIKIGKRFQLEDQPGPRRQHKSALVRIGGLAIGSSFILTLGILALFSRFNEFESLLKQINLEILAPFILITLSFFLLGFAEDIFVLNPFFRLVSQAAIATIAWAEGFHIQNILITSNGPLITMPWALSWLITVLWIVGVTNAFNWLDGLDGLAIGIAAITTIVLSIYCIINQQHLTLLICIIQFGAYLGFLIHNFFPAKILMGDSGSYYIGSSISLLTLLSINQSSNGFSLGDILIYLPLLILFLPLCDMVIVITKRIIKGHSPFFPDRTHIHHRILLNGVSHKNSVLSIYFLNLIPLILSLLIYLNDLIKLIFIIPILLLFLKLFLLKTHKNI